MTVCCGTLCGVDYTCGPLRDRTVQLEGATQIELHDVHYPVPATINAITRMVNGGF